MTVFLCGSLQGSPYGPINRMIDRQTPTGIQAHDLPAETGATGKGLVRMLPKYCGPLAILAWPRMFIFERVIAAGSNIS